MITRSCLIGLIIDQYTPMPIRNIAGTVTSNPRNGSMFSCE